MQQGGGGPTQSQYGLPVPPADTTPPATAALTTHLLLSDQSQQQQLVEEASPISSRPPATAAGTLDEFMRLSGTGADEDEADRAGGVASGNRWPRQETLALLQIRSEMDSAFRDATVKGPLWEDVSRKLMELGYKRNAKKCKEKFENVHKYYKRTKEGRAGRQDGKSYRFFSQLEALHNTGPATTSIVVSASQPTPATTTLDVSPVSIGIPMPVTSIRLPPSTIGISSVFPPDLTATLPPAAVSAPPAAASPPGISFSLTSDGSSSSSSSQEDDEDEPFNTAAGSSRKRKRQSSKGGASRRRMMEFFEGLMKRVMQKQEAMQQRFLDAIEKREHDRMIREEAWKRQEMARLTREHELMAQERAISASRDAAIVSFLQKITGQTIQLPPPVKLPTVPQPPPPPPAPAPAPAPPPQPQPTPLAPVVTVSIQQPPRPQPALVVSPQQQNKQERQQQQQVHHQSFISTEVATEEEVPPREIGSIGSLEPTSTRWPKAEVLALVKLRSGLETKYQEMGPKGPLWEEISAGMQRMGYKRSSKRCKEKWENINKYFKKVKESNKHRPEDAKTCPYFHELDALYRKKILGSSSAFANQNKPEEPQQQQKESLTSDPVPPAKPDNSTDDVSASELQNKNGRGADVNTGLPGSLFGEGNEGAGSAKKPEDIVKEFMKLQGTQKPQQQEQQHQLIVHEYGKMEEGDDSEEDDVDEHGDNDDEEEEQEEEDGDIDDDDDELEEERMMAYKIEFQRQNTSASNGGGNEAPSFLAIVQ